jgi:trimeric autotransporter adhesin
MLGARNVELEQTGNANEKSLRSTDNKNWSTYDRYIRRQSQPEVEDGMDPLTRDTAEAVGFYSIKELDLKGNRARRGPREHNDSRPWLSVARRGRLRDPHSTRLTHCAAKCGRSVTCVTLPIAGVGLALLTINSLDRTQTSAFRPPCLFLLMIRRVAKGCAPRFSTQSVGGIMKRAIVDESTSPVRAQIAICLRRRRAALVISLLGGAASIVSAAAAQAQDQTDTVLGTSAFATGQGSYNTAIGAFTLWQNESGNGNTVVGYTAMYWSTTGWQNTAVGNQSLNQNRTGTWNTAIGQNSLIGNTTGSNNTGSGIDAGACSTTASNNTATGAFSLSGGGIYTLDVPWPTCPGNGATGSENTSTGAYSMFNNLTGTDNTATGYEALQANTSGNNNVASGVGALYSNTNGSSNTASGHQVLYKNTTGYHQTAEGASALYSNTTGNDNVAFGYDALFSNTTGSSNIGIGNSAGYLLTRGSNNIDIANQGTATDSGVIRIGAAGTNTQTFVAGVSNSKITGSAVYVTSSGQLGVLASSERYKTDVTTMGSGSERLAALRPVTFHLKNDAGGELQYGLIAEEVAKVYPELVIRGAEGTIEGVRYEELTPMLLNQVQYQQRELDGQSQEIAALKRQLSDVVRVSHEMQASLQILRARDLRIAMR